MKNTIRKSYLSHRASAERRGIPFRFTFDEWWSIWAPHWERRETDSLDMCRTADSGAYEVGNVRIDTRVANHAERSGIVQTGKLDASVDALNRGTLPYRVARFEKRAVELALMRSKGNATEAAARLGITFRQIRHLMQRHNVTRKSVTL